MSHADSTPNGTASPHANGHANGRSRASANGILHGDSAFQQPKIDLSGPGWYVEHVNPGETMQQVLSRSQHEVRSENVSVLCFARETVSDRLMSYKHLVLTPSLFNPGLARMQ